MQQAENGVDAATISKVMSEIGSKKTEKKLESARANLAAGRERLQDPDVRALLSQRQKERRQKEREAREAAGLVAAPTEKKPRGRPKTRPESAEEPRPRGRPRKTAEAAQTSAGHDSGALQAQEGAAGA